MPTTAFEVVSIFPEMFASVLEGSVLGKAIARSLFAVHFTDPRDFVAGKPPPEPTEPPHASHQPQPSQQSDPRAGKRRQVDDAPYGGGGGMVMRPDPLVAAIEHVERERGPAHKILLTPSGRPLDQAAVVRLARLPRLLFVCGRYEGIDDRVRPFVDEEVSLGDFVLTGGELAAMALIDACARRLPGVLGNEASPLDESFEAGLLEHPQYTRPPAFRGAPVPEVLVSGDHEKVRLWRRRESLLRTRARRPDLFARHTLTDEDRELLDEPRRAPAAPVHARTFAALVHHPVYDRDRRTITSALTNLDLHDLARSSRTYGLAGLFIVTPIEAQRDLATGILAGWRDAWPGRNDFRKEALDPVRVVASVDEARAAVLARTTRAPRVVATSARSERPSVGYAQLMAEAAGDENPLLILFGTGWGLADEVLDRVDRVLAPIRPVNGGADYNHLSVRSAAAIVLDRLFGDGSPPHDVDSVDHADQADPLNQSNALKEQVP